MSRHWNIFYLLFSLLGLQMYGLCGPQLPSRQFSKKILKKLSLRISLRENFEAKVIKQVY